MCALYLLGVAMAWAFKKRDPKAKAEAKSET
jgi:hypothetical protein